MVRILVMLLALLTVAAVPGGSKPFQRIVLAPGCYSIGPGGTYDVSAYCLDESMQAPAPGTTISSAPDSLGQTVIKSGGSVTSLQTAMQRGLIQLEGLGGADYFHVRVRNLSSGKIEICVTSPTVLLGDEGYPTTDLKKVYRQLADILTQAGGTTGASGNQDLETHLKIQKRIWEVMAAIRPKSDSQDYGDWSSPVPGAKQGVPDRDDCAGPPNTVVVCPTH
ncbi:MAG: hypothetical protein WDN69_18155 [Aliidongia sp.]